MGAASEIRAGILQKYQALEAAGLNEREVEFVKRVSTSGASQGTGKQGGKVEHRISIKPNPAVSMMRREGLTAAGTPIFSDADLEGAFPTSLAGVVMVNGVDDAGVILQNMTPESFRREIEAADYFIIDGEKYVYASLDQGGGAGSLKVDKYQTKWKARLVRADKQ